MVLHRPEKKGLGKAYIQGFQQVMASGAQTVIQMDADWSHDPAYLPTLVGALESDVPGHPGLKPVIAIGSRYVKGGGVVGWGPLRKVISRGGSLFARTVLGLTAHDLTGGFKAYRRTMLEELPFAELHSGGYVFQIETTFLGTRHGEKIVEIPIVFVDRQRGQSKMSRRIFLEAFFVVLQLRWEELRGQFPATRSRAARAAGGSASRPSKRTHHRSGGSASSSTCARCKSPTAAADRRLPVAAARRLRA